MGILPILAISAAMGVLIDSSNQDLRALVKTRGSVEILVLKEYSPVELAELAQNAGTVARVLVSESRSELIADMVWTNYTVQVLSVAKGDHALESKTIKVRRPGGSVSLEGGTLLARDPDFLPFHLAEEYVLFLMAAPEGHYVIPFGAQGAFKVDGGKVSQVSQDTGTWNRERGAVRLPEFLTEAVAAAKAK